MARKHPFPPEPDTKPEVPKATAVARASGPAPKSDRERAEAPTLPPPRLARGTGERPRDVRAANERTATGHGPGHATADRRSARESGRPSGVRARRPGPSTSPAATVDEVVADLSKDPRRDQDDD
ncbi:MAG: hypothetical protein JOZ69_06880 [Myxococcales bacterium]|nr:hypothetical protein [Myxococcales bacterium]